MIACPDRAPLPLRIAPLLASDAVNPISPRIRDPQQHPRKHPPSRDPSHESEDEDAHDSRHPPAPTRRTPADSSDDEVATRIDIVVAGTPLPTGQLLPARAPASCVH